MDRRFSTAELAAHSGLPVPSVKLLVREGVLTPSIKPPGGRGHGMVFGFNDVIAASAVNALRFKNMAAEPLKHVVEFFRSERGEALAAELVPLSGQPDREPRVLLVTERGVAVDTTPAALMKKEKTQVVYCLDAQELVGELWLASTQAFMRFDFQEPGPGGRVPRKTRARGKPSGRKKRERVVEEGSRRAR